VGQRSAQNPGRLYICRRPGQSSTETCRGSLFLYRCAQCERIPVRGRALHLAVAKTQTSCTRFSVTASNLRQRVDGKLEFLSIRSLRESHQSGDDIGDHHSSTSVSTGDRKQPISYLHCSTDKSRLSVQSLSHRHLPASP
jgi:hypothetical protein